MICIHPIAKGLCSLQDVTLRCTKNVVMVSRSTQKILLTVLRKEANVLVGGFKKDEQTRTNRPFERFRLQR